ncbi:MAG: universal stress protein [Candidatus Lustribacter sp.]
MSNLFSHILVGVDDSEASQTAVLFATQLAREHGSRLVLCHSVNWTPVLTQIAASGAIVDTVSVVEELKAAGEVLLDQAVAAAKHGGVDAERRAVEGEPAQSLLEAAVQSGCSLIVMGTHGRQGLAHLFVGSTTEAVLRGSIIPVLTLHAGTVVVAPGERCIERIIAGIDESEPSDAAIQTILDLPGKDRLHVIFYSIAGMGEREHERAHQAVSKAVRLANERGISARGRVNVGDPAEALIAAAEQQEADLIVVGSHGRHGLERLVLGSVAEGIVQRSPLPVLVVRTRQAVAVVQKVRAAANRVAPETSPA